MSISSVNSLKANLTNPARSYLWSVVFPNPIGGGNGDTLMLRCQSTSMPGRSVGNITVPFQAGADLQYPGKLKYEHTWSCTFLEGEDSAVLTAFYAWAQTIVNDDTNVGGNQADILSDIYLQMVSTNNVNYAQYRLVNCYVESIGQVELDYTTEAIIKVPITFRYNSWEYSGSE